MCRTSDVPSTSVWGFLSVCDTPGFSCYMIAFYQQCTRTQLDLDVAANMGAGVYLQLTQLGLLVQK